MRFWITFVLIFSVFCCSLPAQAVSTQELLQRIEQLERRVAVLEKLLNQSSQQEVRQVGSVISFNGEGIQNTQPFTAKKPWTLEWKANADIFAITIYTKEGDFVGIVGNAQSGSSYQPKPGTYYLNVNSNGRWVINVKEE